MLYVQAEALLPNDSDEGESLSEEDSKNSSLTDSAANTSISTQNTSISTQNTSISTQNTSSSGQETSSSTPNTSIREQFSINSEDGNNAPDVQDGTRGVSRNSLSDVETSRGSSGDCDTSVDAE